MKNINWWAVLSIFVLTPLSGLITALIVLRVAHALASSLSQILGAIR